MPQGIYTIIIKAGIKMQRFTKNKAFSLLELMVVSAIICILSVVGVVSYRDYTIKASIAALVPTADKVKNSVEDAHNQGTVFGTTGAQTFVASGMANKPYGLLDIIRVNYGCVNLDIDLGALNLDNTKQLTMTWCPYLDHGAIEWQCGYDTASFADYIKYLPPNCQANVNTAIQDTSF